MSNKPKKNVGKNNYANANFFATYHEENKKYAFTLPVGHLLCDYNLNPSSNKNDYYCDKYCHERGTVANGKFTFDSSTWSYQNKFCGKSLSTLTIKNGFALISDMASIKGKGFDYAISGVPLMKAGRDISWLNYVRRQGWDGSELYATWHIILALKQDRTKIYVIAIKTTTSNMIYSGEIFKKLSALGFLDAIKLDGGGSAQLTVDGKSKVSTYENRRINAIVSWGSSSSNLTNSTNPYKEPIVVLKRGSIFKEGVRWLQWQLNHLGYTCDIDGSFGPATDALVRKFQKDHNLVVDGYVGPATKKALKE